jgi:hypothetical protein
MGTPIADRLELLDEDWLAETIDDSLDVDWTGRVAARLILDRMPEITEAASVIRELVEVVDQYVSDLRYPPQGGSIQRRIELASKALSRARGEV